MSPGIEPKVGKLVPATGLKPDYQIRIAAYLDDTGIYMRTGLIRKEVAHLKGMQDQVEVAVKDTRANIITAMQGSYMMAYGLSRFMGGGMAQVFYTLHSLSVSAIAAWTAIAEAAFHGGSYVQAGLMSLALYAAWIQVASLVKGQTKYARQLRGLTTSLHGMAGMIGSFSLGG